MGNPWLESRIRVFRGCATGTFLSSALFHASVGLFPASRYKVSIVGKLFRIETTEYFAVDSIARTTLLLALCIPKAKLIRLYWICVSIKN